MAAIKEAALVANVVPQADPMLSMIERFVTDPSVDVTKLEKLVEMHERAMAKAAENAFNASMSTAQEQMKPISADATNPQTKSRYASYAQLDRALRPIYTEHGFALSFNTDDCPAADHIRVLCDVTNGAHCKRYRLDMPADGKGAKGGDVMTKTHAAGSAVTYGMRYLLKMIFNVAVGEDDDDGNQASGRKIEAPEGFDEWFAHMRETAQKGVDALTAAWKCSDESYLRYIRAIDWEGLKADARKADAAMKKADGRA